MDTNQTQLDDTSRTKLDSIVQKMVTNKESDTNIQAVVDDFKQKYGQPVLSERDQRIKEGLPVGGGALQQGLTNAKPTFLGNVIRAPLTLAARVGTNLINAGQEALGKPLTQPFSSKYLGKVTGIGSGSTGTDYGLNPQNLKQSLGAGLEAGSYLIGGEGITPLAEKGVAGLIRQGTIQGLKTGASVGTLGGAAQSLQNNEGIGNFLKNTATGAGVGVLTGGLLGAGGSLLGKAIDLAKNGNPEASASIMNRVARLTPTQANKFQDLAGMSHGEYLTRTGNFGTPEQIIQKESQKFVNSLDQVDSTLAKLPGLYHSDPVSTALSELSAREKNISTPGAPSPTLEQVNTLVKANNGDGLSMSQINQVKRIYEREIKLNYKKDFTGQSSEKLARATNIDSAMRNWQLNQANNLGFSNIQDINKQTQISKSLIDSLGKQITGKKGNDVLDLSDWIMLSHGNPASILGFLTKKAFSTKEVQSNVAKLLSKAQGNNLIKANLQPTIENSLRTQFPKGIPLQLEQGQKELPNIQNKVPIEMGGTSKIEKGFSKNTTQESPQVLRKLKSSSNSSTELKSGKATIGTLLGASGVSVVASKLLNNSKNSQNIPKNTSSIYSSIKPVSIPGTVPITTIQKEISRRESGGTKNPYTAQNTNSNGTSDYGKYQVNQNMLNTYYQKFMGEKITPAQFLLSPEKQEAFFTTMYNHAIKDLGVKTLKTFLTLWHGNGFSNINKSEILRLQKLPEMQKYLNK